MNKMKLEEIKNTAAEEVFDGTEYEWDEMMDNTAEVDRSLSKLVDEDQIKDFYLSFFRDMLREMRREDRDEIIAQYGMKAKFHIQPEYLEQWGNDVDEDYVVTMDEAIHLADEWNKPLRALIEQLEEV